MRGVIYARYSSEKQREESIIGQVRDCEEFARRQGIEIVGVYKDEAISARTDRRPSFQKMIHDSVSGSFDCIIVWKGDRFSRNRGDAATYKAQLKKRGIRVLYAMEPNVDGPEAVLFEGINEAYAEFYSAELAVKISRGLRENVIAGKYNGGRPTFGFDVVDSRLVINEKEAKVVRLVYDLYANQGLSIPKIIDRLKSIGAVNKNGKPFCHATLYGMLKRELYLGIKRMGDVVNSETVAPIVDVETFRKAEARLALNLRMRSSFRTGEKFLLSGKLFCGECGARMNGDGGTSRNKSKILYYSCRARKPKGFKTRSFRKDALENAVVSCVADFLKDKKKSMALTETIKSFVDEGDPEVTLTKKAVEEYTEKIERVISLVEGGADLPDVNKRLTALNAAREAQKKRLYELERDAAFTSEEAIDYFMEALKRAGSKSMQSKQFLIDNFVKAVYVFPDRSIIVFFNFRDGIGEIRSNEDGSTSVSYAPPIIKLSEPLVYIDKYYVGVKLSLKPYLAKYTTKGSSSYKTIAEYGGCD